MMRSLFFALGVSFMAGAVSMPAAARQDDPAPVELHAYYLGDAFANLRGGIKTGARAMGKLGAILDADASAIGIAGARLHVDLQYVHGQSLSNDLVGDAQVVSNIDAVSALRPMEAYFALPFGEAGQATLKLGLIDLNVDFDVQRYGAFFLNSSHGIAPDVSQSGLNGPSIFPTSASAVTVQWRGRGWTGRLGLFDAVAGDPDHPRRTVVRFPGTTGLLMVGEVDLAIGGGGELQVGAWRYTPRFARIDAAGAEGKSQGFYALVEGPLARQGEAEMGGWIRIGVASDAVNPIGLYLGGGATFGTEDRRIGLAVAHARLGDSARLAADLYRAETTIELSYAHRVHPRILLQPDVQYVVHPGWHPSRRDAIVAGMRVHLTLF